MTGRWDQEDGRASAITSMALGALIAGLCGVCTWDVWRGKDVMAGLAVLGFVPIGLGLFLFGKGLTQFLGSGE